MRPRDEHWQVLGLAAEGRNTSQIARTLGIPRSTVRDWLRDPKRPCEKPGPACERCGRPPHVYDALPKPEYSYLLGIYLSDGHISRLGKTYRLRIFMDMQYQGIIREVMAAVSAVIPQNRVSVRHGVRGDRMSIISSYSTTWPCLLPQHGLGPKHARPIFLAPWQETILDLEAFVRGLIHSDGCRVLNRVNGKDYPRSFFTQASLDIKELFCDALRELGIQYTWNNARNVSIARAPSVARLDEFVGAKF